MKKQIYPLHSNSSLLILYDNIPFELRESSHHPDRNFSQRNFRNRTTINPPSSHRWPPQRQPPSPLSLHLYPTLNSLLNRKGSNKVWSVAISLNYLTLEADSIGQIGLDQGWKGGRDRARLAKGGLNGARIQGS